jgi:hypothetical protein
MCSNTLIIRTMVVDLPVWGLAKSSRVCVIMGRYAEKSLLGTNLMSNLMSVEI